MAAVGRSSVVYGGFGNGSYLGDTWMLSGTTWTVGVIDGAPARAGAPLAFDAGRHDTVLFGGRNANVGYCSDTWTLG